MIKFRVYVYLYFYFLICWNIINYIIRIFIEINKFENLKNENESLKLDLKEKCQKISNFEKKYGDVTNLEKISVFKEKNRQTCR